MVSRLTTALLLFIYSVTHAQNQPQWNVLMNASISASGYLQGFSPDYLYNAKSPICWTVQGGGVQWLELNFNVPATINKLELTIGHTYKGEPINVYGRSADGNYELLHHFENEQLDGDSLLDFTPAQPWADIEFIRMESPESPLTLCWRHLGLIGFIPGRIPPDFDLCDSTPDLIYYNAQVITMDTANPLAEAVAIKRNKIMAVGSNEALLELRRAGCGTSAKDLQGLTILPGFNDSHSHWISWRQHICEPSGDTTYPSYEDIMTNLSQNGWTSISELNFGRPDDGSGNHFYDALDLDFRGKLSVRLNGYWGSLNDGSEIIDVLADSGRTPKESFSGRVRAPGVKIYVDDPFGTTDILTQGEVDERIQKSFSNGWQVAAHAVNESAVEKILSAYETVLGSESNENFRLRIEHAVKVSDDQLSRMQTKGILASFQLFGPSDWPDQTTFQTYISNTHPEWCLRWKDFMDAGIPVTGSSDAPFNNSVCNYSPFRGIFEMVTRLGYLSRVHASWELDQRLTIEQCLELLTIDGAYATFEEDKKGSITEGKWADLVIVSDNPLEVTDPGDLLNIRVLMTMVGGHTEYCDDSYIPELCESYNSFSVNSASVIASNYLGDETPDYAYDGDPETSWGSGDYAPQWVQIDLMHNYKINGVDLVVAQYPSGHTVHQILGKGDIPGGELQLMHEFNGNTSDYETLRYSAPPTLDSMRFIRILTTESPSWIAWREIVIRKDDDILSINKVENPYTGEISNLIISPLPLKEESVIEFQINRACNLTGVIYGIDGKKLMTFIDQFCPEGHYSIPLNKVRPQQLSSGVYFLKISSEKNNMVKKLVKL